MRAWETSAKLSRNTVLLALGAFLVCLSAIELGETAIYLKLLSFASQSSRFSFSVYLHLFSLLGLPPSFLILEASLSPKYRNVLLMMGVPYALTLNDPRGGGD